MKTTIEPYEELGDWEDGDWEIKLYLEEAVLITYVTSAHPDSALDQALDKLSHLIAVEEPEEAVIELKGIWK